jgi:hypothetical protein
LCIVSEDIIVDPGTYVYKTLPKWQNKFRSTEYHTIVMIDGKEQNSFVENNLFLIKNNSIIKINQWKCFKEYDVLEVIHDKHKIVKGLVAYGLRIIFNKKEKQLEIIDTFEGEENID